MKIFKILYIVMVISFLTIGCGSSGGGAGDNSNVQQSVEEQKVAQEIAKLDDVETSWKVGKYFYTNAIREHIPTAYPDEINTLLSIDSISGKMLVDKFKGEATFMEDTSLCIFAYLIEQLNYRDSVPTLEAWLETNIFNDVQRAPDCVTHAIKVLTDQNDIDDVYYSYSFEEILDTFERANNLQTSALSQFGYWLRNVFSPSVSVAATGISDKCFIQSEITGVDIFGNIVRIPFKGNVWKTDFDEAANITQEAINNRIEEDNSNYGYDDPENPHTDDYKKISNSVSRKQDCAGYVAQMVFGVEETFQSSDPDFILKASEAFGEEEPLINYEIRGIEGRSHVGVWQKSDGTVSHVFFIESRHDGAYIVSKDSFGFVREKKLEALYDFGAEVYQYPYTRFGSYLDNITDKQQKRYPNDTLRIFKINKSRLMNGSEPSTFCSTDSSCPASVITPLTNSISYAQCSVTVINPDNDSDGYNSTASGGDDCNDDDASIHPGATDIANDGIDQDCDGVDSVIAVRKYHVFKHSGTGYRKMWGGWANKITGYGYYYEYIYPDEVQGIIDRDSNFAERTAGACEGGPALCPCAPYPDIWVDGSVELIGSFETSAEVDAYRCDNPHYMGYTYICNMWETESAQGDTFWDPINGICGG